MKIKFDGKELEIKPLNLNQLIEVEEKHGSLVKFGDAIPLRAVRFIAYMLIHPHIKELTEEQIGEKLDMETIGGIAKVVTPAARVGNDRPFTSP